MIKRQIMMELEKHLATKEITLIVGPRQAGKTTLLLLLKESLEKRGAKTLLFNMDIENDQRHFINQEALVSKIKLEFGSDSGTVFIDEIQRKADAGLFLKGLYDMRLPYKFVVTGSGSLELKEKIHESLAGRKRMFELSTLSFEEFANFKTGYKYEDRLEEFFNLESNRLTSLLSEYMLFGAYPRLVLEEALADKERIINEIYQSYLERDIGIMVGDGKSEAFSRLLRLLAEQAGQLMNISELSSTLSISVKTINQYIWYMEKTYILRRLTPFFKNARKEITKSPVSYFTDLGLLNFATRSFGREFTEGRGGFIFQNFVCNILYQKCFGTPKSLHFWRSKDKAEVDFVIDDGQTPVPIEVKYSSKSNIDLPRSLVSFTERYKPALSLIVYRGPETKRVYSGTKVLYIPFHKLAKLNLDM
ncbi:MAG TPA: ATP-binding protein [Candidatus Paceibacterota bacterium]